jgi:hypothetical protein
MSSFELMDLYSSHTLFIHFGNDFCKQFGFEFERKIYNNILMGTFTGYQIIS